MSAHEHVHAPGAPLPGALPMAPLAACCCGGDCGTASPTRWRTAGEGLGLAAALLAETADWLSLGKPWLPVVAAIVAIAACGLPVYKKGLLALRRLDCNINALMTIAATGAVVLGQYPEAAMVLALFALAERLEDASLARAKRAVTGLLALAPETAVIRREDGGFARVPAATVPVGAVIRLAPGERVPLDGRVRAGHSSVDQSPVTGESLPVDKGPGDGLFAGSVNGEGELLFVATTRADASTLARIIRAVTASPGKQAPMKRFVDRFAAVYTPAVVLFALGLAVFPPLLWDGDWAGWVYKALVLLVIACPCALVISTPVTVVSGLAAGARRGILVKGGLFLEQGHAIATVVLDKTGTITTGRPAQTDGANFAGEAARNRSLAASLAERSDHPVSRAVAEAARADGVPLLPVADFAAQPGQGVTGAIDGRTYRLGNPRQLSDLGPCPSDVAARLDRLEADGNSVVLLADDSGILALFAVADTVRGQSRQAVADLHRLGVETILLSGDNAATTAAIAKAVGIDRAQGDQLPEDKAAAIDELMTRPDRRGLVAMVGDGINDAPALARCHIGLAMGAAGTDAAIETADVAIMDDDPRKVAAFIRLSRATVSILRQNIALALGLKGLVLVLTVLGYGSMLLAVFADMGTSLLVIANGLRVLRK